MSPVPRFPPIFHAAHPRNAPLSVQRHTLGAPGVVAMTSPSCLECPRSGQRHPHGLQATQRGRGGSVRLSDRRWGAFAGVPGTALAGPAALVAPGPKSTRASGATVHRLRVMNCAANPSNGIPAGRPSLASSWIPRALSIGDRETFHGETFFILTGLPPPPRANPPQNLLQQRGP